MDLLRFVYGEKELSFSREMFANFEFALNSVLLRKKSKTTFCSWTEDSVTQEEAISHSSHSLLSRRRSEDRTLLTIFMTCKEDYYGDINVPLCCSLLSILCVPFTSIYSTFLQIRQCHDNVLGNRGIRQVLCRELGCRGCDEDCDHAE